MFRLIQKRIAVTVGGWDQEISAIYVRDVVTALLAAASVPRAAGRTYCVAHPVAVTLREFTATVGRVLGRRPVLHGSRRRRKGVATRSLFQIGAYHYVTSQHVLCTGEIQVTERTTRFNVQLDERHAMKLYDLAERIHVNPGTLARSLLTTALEEAAPDPSSIVELLDAIPGAYARAQQGLRETQAGQGIPLDEL